MGTSVHHLLQNWRFTSHVSTSNAAIKLTGNASVKNFMLMEIALFTDITSWNSIVLRHSTYMFYQVMIIGAFYFYDFFFLF
jgi:hypothetical protein